MQQQIQRLQRSSESSFPVISVYLTMPSEKKSRKILLRKRFLEIVNANFNEKQQNMINQDIDYIDAYLQLYNHFDRYQGVAIFSGGNKLWEVILTPFSLPTLLVKGHSPHLDPLLQKISHYQPSFSGARMQSRGI